MQIRNVDDDDDEEEENEKKSKKKWIPLKPCRWLQHARVDVSVHRMFRLKRHPSTQVALRSLTCSIGATFFPVEAILIFSKYVP